ncbi:branched-chain amino acid transaminase [Mastigocoleus sp. MO_188.B34]|uniref:branched-chain amino acid transaminase n=1 Tax=Mastigocoleus sp. MO_188.B34 TaxID=3036635 RepID=UPI00261505B9|nr:branched-chain amino acid transaminase [Mastigocoleus sp. MO_188.B34]MDJ0694436.1 branched-chain amino acid transaminase [Mastigocoleus sp. MO_188.B34]
MNTTATEQTAQAGEKSTPSFLSQAYLQGSFLPFEQAQISIATHALHYGTAVLGGIRGLPSSSISNQILLFRLDAHCQRLSNSAKFLGYSITSDFIKSTLLEFVYLNQPNCPFYLRPLIYTSGLGIAPRLHKIEKDFLIYGLSVGDNLFAPEVRCRISSWCRQEDRSQPLRGKLSASYIASALAKTEAVNSGFDEAIMMNSQGKVSEASGMNLFLVRNGELITPSFDQDILEGITRDSIITIASNLGISVRERPIDKSELFIADEAFLCGTAAQISSILSIENYSFPNRRPMTKMLRERLKAVMEDRDPKYSHWITKVQLHH